MALLKQLDLEGVLLQADALHYQKNRDLIGPVQLSVQAKEAYLKTMQLNNGKEFGGNQKLAQNSSLVVIFRNAWKFHYGEG